MRRIVYVAALAILAAPSLALAQFATGAGGAPSSSAASTDPSSGAVVPPAFTPPPAPPSGTVGNSTLSNQPGVPNTTTPGTIGTGASPSGLPGDSPTAPGFPATGTK